ncbi:MAG: AsmA-like C-terminal region-containing protein [Bacteroidales bacterium]|nr:AsmA-like C-terminal region-containing protein [Bacteroidales bacterium]
MEEKELNDNNIVTESTAGADDAASERDPKQRGRRPRRPWWLRWLRGLGWTALSLAVAAVIICSAVVWVLSPDQLTPIIGRVASRVLNADVTVGRAELTFWSSFPKIKIEIDDLEVVSRSLDELSDAERAALPVDADSLMSVGHFSGGINLLHLAGGRITIYDVELNRPCINLIQVNDTVSNFNIFPASAPDTTSTPMPEVTINRFAITDALPMRYRSLPDSVDVSVNLRTITLEGSDAPQYKLEMTTRVQTPLLDDVAYETMRFSLDGKINWSAEHPSLFNIDDLHFTLEDDIDMTLSTSVDVSDNLKVDRLDVDLRNIRPTNLIEHMPEPLRSNLATLDTDMSANLSARLLRPYIITDSITFPWMEATLSIPDCHFNFRTIDFRHLSAEIKAEVNGDDLNRSTVSIEHLDIDGKAVDIKLSGTATSLLDDPLLKGSFRGDIDFAALPPILKKQLGGRLTGHLDADTKFNFRLSDLTAEGFHKAVLSGNMNLRNVNYESTDTLTRVYSRLATLTFGTDMSYTADGVRADSLLVVKVTVDTAAMFDHGMESRLKGLRAGFGTTNKAASADTTKINPFGGALHVADLFLYAPDDSVRMRMRDISGFASLQRFKGEERVPKLMLRFSAGRMRLAQPQYIATLTGTKFDINANLRPRRKGIQPLRGAGEADGSALREMSMTDSMANSLQGRMMRLTAEQLDSIGVDVIDFNIDNSFRSILRRWNINGTLQAARGNMRMPRLRLRNQFNDLDVTFNTDSVELRNLNYRFGHSDFKVTGLISNIRQALSVRRPGAVKIDFDINSDSINVNEIVRTLSGANAHRDDEHDDELLDEWAKAEAADIENIDTMPDSLTGPILIPVNIDANLNIHARKVIYSDLVFNDFAGQLLIYHGVANLHNLSAATDVGKISVSALYSAPTADKINLGMAMDLRNFHIDRLPQVIPAIDSIAPIMHYLSGVVNAQVAVTSDITPDMYFDLASLKAAMQFSGDSLVVFDNSTFRSLSRWLMFKDKNRNMIDHLNVEMTISDGVLHLYPFIVDIDRYKLGVMGYNDLDFNLDYHIAVLKSPIPFKFGINLKGMPDKMKIRLGGAKFKENMVAQRDSIAINTRISLLSEINGVFRRGLRAARLGPLRIKGDAGTSYMNVAEETISAADSAVMIKEGLIEVPDSVAAEIFSRIENKNNGNSGK